MDRPLEKRFLLALFAACALGCGSGGPGTPPAPALIQVAGQYQIAVALTENDCGDVEVRPLPTTVAHTAGAASFSLTHGGTTYAGHLAAEGRFTTDRLTLPGSGGSTQVDIAGQFSTGGLQALVTVNLEGPPQCRYVVRWTGTKLGAPNVIP